MSDFTVLAETTSRFQPFVPAGPSLEAAAPRSRALGVRGLRPGPTLICIAGLHGNEPAGVLALERVVARLRNIRPAVRGELAGLIGNRQALALNQRFVREDLNRMWSAEGVARLSGGDPPASAEERELCELHDALQETVGRARGRVVVLDIHSTSGPGGAFVTLDDSLPNRRIALELPVPLVIGLEEELGGTLLHYLTHEGLVNVGFEAGQHEDPASIGRAEAAIWIALEALGVLDSAELPEVAAARRLLEAEHQTLPPVVEVRYRHPVSAEEGFLMRPGYASFRPVERGELIGQNREGPIVAPETALLLMPLYQKQGDDGFFVVRPVRLAWLRLSTRLRRWRWERFIHWLPGVRRQPGRRNSFLVDRRYARVLALQLFHLLGFRRESQEGWQLVMTRRFRGRSEAGHPGKTEGRRARRPC